MNKNNFGPLRGIYQQALVTTMGSSIIGNAVIPDSGYLSPAEFMMTIITWQLKKEQMMVSAIVSTAQQRCIDREKTDKARSLRQQEQ